MKIDKLELWIRFICGALLGLVLGLTLILDRFEGSIHFAFGGVIAISLIFAVLAARYGDRFWYAVLRWLRSVLGLLH